MFPHVKLGVLVCRGLRNEEMAPDEVVAWMRQTEQKLAASCGSVEELTARERIVDWREAYRRFGFKPNQHRSSVEALCRRVVQGKELPQISTLVDVYNTISVKHMVPVGGDDIDRVDGDIILAVADGTESFVMLGEKTKPIKKGEVIYRDDRDVLCRSWNYRESEKSKITEKTTNLCLVIEGLEHTTWEVLEEALQDMQEMLESHCGGAYKQFFLDKNRLEAEF